MNQLRTILFSLLVFSSVTVSHHCIAQPMNELKASQLVFSQNNFSIKFEWLGDSVGTKWEPHAALLLPVKLSNCPKVFYMQFDTGSPSSLFYQNKVNAIKEKYPEAFPVNDTNSKLVNYRFFIGKMPLTATEIGLKNFGDKTIDWSKGSREIIGTLGTDFIDDKVVVIDFPKQKIVIGNIAVKDLALQFELNDFIYARRSILFPATIKGKKFMLYFDTGSSAYELLTDKKTAEALRSPNAQVVQASSKSWGRTITSNTVVTNDSIQIGSSSLPLGHATYMEGVSDSQMSQMMKLGIGGMTGNKLFVKAVLLIDTRNKKFGLVTP